MAGGIFVSHKTTTVGVVGVVVGYLLLLCVMTPPPIILGAARGLDAGEKISFAVGYSKHGRCPTELSQSAFCGSKSIGSLNIQIENQWFLPIVDDIVGKGNRSFPHDNIVVPSCQKRRVGSILSLPRGGEGISDERRPPFSFLLPEVTPPWEGRFLSTYIFVEMLWFVLQSSKFVRAANARKKKEGIVKQQQNDTQIWFQCMYEEPCLWTDFIGFDISVGNHHKWTTLGAIYTEPDMGSLYPYSLGSSEAFQSNCSLSFRR